MMSVVLVGTLSFFVQTSYDLGWESFGINWESYVIRQVLPPSDIKKGKSDVSK